MSILKSDREWLRKVMPYFGIKAVAIDYVETGRKWPDCWIEINRRPPLITVTQEWARQNKDERRKRIVHELLHLKGLRHGKKGRFVYHTKPELDTYSVMVYQNMVRGKV